MKKISIARYMAYLLIITLTITGLSLARYATTSSGSDASRVANFDVQVTHTGSAWSHESENKDVSAHAPGGSKIYTFKVDNYSEVAVRARLVIDSNSAAAPMVSPAGWFEIAAGKAKNVTVTVVGVIGGNDIGVSVEYEQIN